MNHGQSIKCLGGRFDAAIVLSLFYFSISPNFQSQERWDHSPLAFSKVSNFLSLSICSAPIAN